MKHTRLRYLAGLVTLALTLGLASSAVAQTTTTSTTVTNPVTLTDTSLVLASGTGVAAGSMLLIDQELMTVISATTSTAPVVRRGDQGTGAAAHADDAIVYVATLAQAPNVFRSYDRVGPCTATSELFLPQGNIRNGHVQNCVGGYWTLVGGDGAQTVTVTCRALLVADQVDQSCFVVDRSYVITRIQENHSVAESAGTLTLIARRQQSTEAPASGDALNTAIDMVGAGATAQTVKTATLTTTASLLLLSAGERIGLDFTDDTAGELAGTVVTFTLVPR